MQSKTWKNILETLKIFTSRLTSSHKQNVVRKGIPYTHITQLCAIVHVQCTHKTEYKMCYLSTKIILEGTKKVIINWFSLFFLNETWYFIILTPRNADLLKEDKIRRRNENKKTKQKNI